MSSILEKLPALMERRQAIDELRKKTEKAVAAVPVWMVVLLRNKAERQGMPLTYFDEISAHLCLQECEHCFNTANAYRDGFTDEGEVFPPIQKSMDAIEVSLIFGDEEAARLHYKAAAISSRHEYVYLLDAFHAATKIRLNSGRKPVAQRAHLLALLDKQ